MSSERQLNTMETTSTCILSLKPYTTNIKKLNETRIWFWERLSCINIYNAIAYNIIKTGNGSSPNLEFQLQKCFLIYTLGHSFQPSNTLLCSVFRVLKPNFDSVTTEIATGWRTKKETKCFFFNFPQKMRQIILKINKNIFFYFWARQGLTLVLHILI